MGPRESRNQIKRSTDLSFHEMEKWPLCWATNLKSSFVLARLTATTPNTQRHRLFKDKVFMASLETLWQPLPHPCILTEALPYWDTKNCAPKYNIWSLALFHPYNSLSLIKREMLLVTSSLFNPVPLMVCTFSLFQLILGTFSFSFLVLVISKLLTYPFH